MKCFCCFHKWNILNMLAFWVEINLGQALEAWTIVLTVVGM